MNNRLPLTACLLISSLACKLQLTVFSYYSVNARYSLNGLHVTVQHEIDTTELGNSYVPNFYKFPFQTIHAQTVVSQGNNKQPVH